MSDEDRLTLLMERQRIMQAKLEEIEKQQQAALKMVNRYTGGIAFLVGAGLLAGWLFTFRQYFGG